MATTYLHAVASLDGYIADERDDVGPLHDWYFKGGHPLVDEDHADVHGAPFRVSAASADYVRGVEVANTITRNPIRIRAAASTNSTWNPSAPLTRCRSGAT